MVKGRGPRNFFPGAERDAQATVTHVFKNMWPNSLLDKIAESSSGYSKKHSQPVVYTRADILRFFLCCVTMGIIQIPRLDMYW